MQPQVVVVQSPACSGITSQFNATAARVLSGFQVLIGGTLIVLAILGTTRTHFVTLYAYVVVSGIFTIITGAFGLGAASSKRNCLIITFMVFSILCAAEFCTPVIWYSLQFIGVITHYPGWFYIMSEFMQGIIGTMVALAVLEFLLAIGSSVVCCGAVCTCCGAKDNREQGAQLQPLVPPQQVVVMPQAQYDYGQQMQAQAPPQYTQKGYDGMDAY